MDWQVIRSPLREPLSIEQVKEHLRIYDEQSDSLLISYLRAARIWCENFSGRAFLWQKYQARLDCFSSEIILPMPPLIIVSSIKYIDQDGNSQTLDESIYEADTCSEPGRIILAYNQSWPSARGHHQDITIDYIAGHASTFTRSGNALVIANPNFAVDDYVGVYNIGGTLPAGLSTGENYYLSKVSGNQIELSLTKGGNSVVLGDNGSGTHYIDSLPQNYKNAILLKMAELWSNRGDQPFETSKGVKDLLGQGRIVPV